MVYLRSTRTYAMVHVDLTTAPEGTMVKTHSGKTYVCSSQGYWYDEDEGQPIDPESLEKIAEWLDDSGGNAAVCPGLTPEESALIFPDGYMEMCVTVRI